MSFGYVFLLKNILVVLFCVSNWLISYFQIHVPGVAICPLCLNEKISYGNRGLPALTDHVKTRKHYSRVIKRIENYKIPCASEPIDDEMYGAPPAFFHGHTNSKSHTPVLLSVHFWQKNVCRFLWQVCSFACQLSISFCTWKYILADTCL